MPHLFAEPRAVPLSTNITAVSGAKAYFFDAGTTDPRATYPTSADAEARTNPQTWPVLANSVGALPPIWLNASNGPYKVDIQAATGISLSRYPIDNIPLEGSISLTDAEESVGPQIVDDLSYKPVNPWRYGADGAGGVVDQAASADALAVLDESIGMDQWKNGLSVPGYIPTTAEKDAAIVITRMQYEVGSSPRYMDRTGVTDSTVGLGYLARIAQASGFYGHPWFGVAGASPIITVKQGRYRLTGTTTICTGTTLQGEGHPANTTNHTRLMMDSTTVSPPSGAGDNRNKPMFRLTRKSLSDVLMNGACTFAVTDLEFLYVTIGSTFDTPLSGSAIDPANYPDGCTWLIDVDCTDVRWKNVVFQHSTRSMLIRNVSLASNVRGDGVTGASGVFMFFSANEWDAQSIHWQAENSHLGLTFNGDQFFSGRQIATACTGSVSYDACVLENGARIDFSDGGNSFTKFRYHGRAELSTSGSSTIFVTGAKNVDIDIIMDGNSPISGIVLYNCDGGRVRVVAQNSGYNASAGTGAQDFVAVVKLMGCRDVHVEATITDTAGGGSYNGFGVLSVDSDRTALRNVVSGCLITAPFNGASHRGQGRFINVAPADFVGYNMTYPGGTAISSLKPSRLDLASLPTSTSGLLSGQAWNDTGTVKVVP